MDDELIIHLAALNFVNQLSITSIPVLSFSISMPNELTRNAGDGASTSSQEQSAGPSKASTGVDAVTITEEDDGKISENSPTSLLGHTASFPEVPMLDRLVKEAETAKFYAYCEEVSSEYIRFSLMGSNS